MADVDDLAGQVIGFDGTPEQVATAAAVIAELVRRLNHATRRPGLDTNTVDNLTRDLHATTARLPQLLQQLAAQLIWLEQNPKIASDDNRPAAAVTGFARMMLGYAVKDLEPLERHLAEAAQQTSRLYLR